MSWGLVQQKHLRQCYINPTTQSPLQARTVCDEANYNLGQGLENIILYAFCPSVPTPRAMLTIHFHLPQVCTMIFPIFQHWKRNRGADTYSVGITVMISCFCTFPINICPWLLVQFSYNIYPSSQSILWSSRKLLAVSCRKIWYFEHFTTQLMAARKTT